MGVYDIVANFWRTLESPGNAGHMTMDGLYIYAARNTNFQRYSPFTGNWENLPSPPASLHEGWGGMEYHNGYIYVARGPAFAGLSPFPRVSDKASHFFLGYSLLDIGYSPKCPVGCNSRPFSDRVRLGDEAARHVLDAGGVLP